MSVCVCVRVDGLPPRTMDMITLDNVDENG